MQFEFDQQNDGSSNRREKRLKQWIIHCDVFVPFVHFLNKIISSFNWFLFPVVIFERKFILFTFSYRHLFECIKWKMNKMPPSMLFFLLWNFLFLSKQKDFAKQKHFILNILSCCFLYFIFLCLSPTNREVVREKMEIDSFNMLKSAWAKVKPQMKFNDGEKCVEY